MNNQMDKSKFLEWLDGEDAAVLWEGPDGLMKYDMLVEAINSGEFAPDTPPVPTIKPGDKVRHVSIGTHGLAVETSDVGVFVHWSTGQRSWYPYASLEVVE